MKNIHYFITCLFFALQSFKLGFYNAVEARRGDVIPLGQLYGSSEPRHLKNSEINHHVRDSFEYEKAEFPEFKKRKTKRKHKVVKNKNFIVNNSVDDKLKKKKRKRDRKRFVKTTLKHLDKDSNLSDSQENGKKVKPVDIIVHIKMKD